LQGVEPIAVRQPSSLYVFGAMVVLKSDIKTKIFGVGHVMFFRGLDAHGRETKTKATKTDHLLL
jgi:hypothetical protein